MEVLILLEEVNEESVNAARLLKKNSDVNYEESAENLSMETNPVIVLNDST